MLERLGPEKLRRPPPKRGNWGAAFGHYFFGQMWSWQSLEQNWPQPLEEQRRYSQVEERRTPAAHLSVKRAQKCTRRLRGARVNLDYFDEDMTFRANYYLSLVLLAARVSKWRIRCLQGIGIVWLSIFRTRVSPGIEDLPRKMLRSISKSVHLWRPNGTS